MPPPQNPRLTALWGLNPSRAAAIVIGVLQRPRMTLEDAAVTLHVSLRTLYRWLEEHPELKELRGKIPLGIAARRQDG